MKDKIRALFTRNIGMKLLSVVVGIAIWIVLSNAQDPTVSRTISIPVTYINGGQLIEKEQHVLLSGPDTVQITATVRQSNLSRLRSDLFTCTADLMDHGGGDLKSQRVHVSVSQVSGWDIIIDWNYYRSDPNITVVMDDYIEKTFTIGLRTSSEMQNGLILREDIAISPSSVTISGPMTRFSNIASVKASVDLEQLSDLGVGTFKLNVPLRLYDANDNAVSNMDGALALETDTAQITAVIAKEGTVGIRAEGVTGTPEYGYRFSGISVKPDTVAVQGLRSDSGFTEIVIPASDIDISGISQNTVFEVDISKYLPEGVEPADGASIVKVNVSVEQMLTQQVTVPVSNITVVNKQPQYNYAIEGSVTALYIRGYRDELAQFSASSLNPWISVGGLEAGRHSVPVTITQPSGYIYENADSLYVTVVVTPQETAPSETPTVPTQPYEPPTDNTEVSETPETDTQPPESEPSQPEDETGDETEPPETEPAEG